MKRVATRESEHDDLPLLKAVRWLTVVLALASAACASHQTRTGDTLAGAGDWESALIQYRLAAQEDPNDARLRRKISTAEDKVIAIWTRRGDDANAAGQLGEAGAWWVKAIELSAKRAEESGSASEDAKLGRDTKAWRRIEANATALEYFGDVAAAQANHEDAVGVYGALLKVHPDRVDLVQKHLEGKRAFAAELFARARAFADRDLLGAALVTDLRALQHDPMQEKAFASGSRLRKDLRARNRVNLTMDRVDHKGFKAFGAALSRVIAPRLDEFAPYGPTRDPDAKKARLAITVETFSKDETTVKGTAEMPNTIPPSTIPVPNPAVAEQKKVIDGLEATLAGHRKELKAAVARAARRGKGKPMDEDGLAAARAVDATRLELQSAKERLAALPATVPPPLPPPTWTLPWEETSRWVEARVRFEIHEPEFALPISLVLTQRIERSDRTHEGHERQGVEPDALTLPTYEELVASLATEFREGARVIEQARQHRVERLVETGRERMQAGDEAEALDAFVSVLFMMGPQALPEDAAAFVSRELEHDRFKEILALQ